MVEICPNCKKVIREGETTITMVKNLRKNVYHARCYGAKHLEPRQPNRSPASLSQ